MKNGILVLLIFQLSLIFLFWRICPILCQVFSPEFQLKNFPNFIHIFWFQVFVEFFQFYVKVFKKSSRITLKIHFLVLRVW
jgi:hypothetical protein